MEDIEKFLEETSDYWNDNKLYNQAVTDASKLAPDVWVRKYKDTIESNPDIALDFYNSKLLTKTKSLPERLRSSFGNHKFAPSDSWKQAVYQSEYEDVPREEFEKVLSNMRKYYEDEERYQDSIAGIKRRTEEVRGEARTPEGRLDKERNWGFIRNLLSSDYAKERYIHEPETAIIGYEAPNLGEASETRTAAIADLGAGTAGAITDFIPPAWWAGPLIRGARDAVYYGTDSPYAKSEQDIIKSIGADFAINRGAKFFDNARKAQKVTKSYLTKEAERTMKADELNKLIDKQVNGTLTYATRNATNDAELINIITDLEDSPLKKELMAEVNKAKLGTPLDRNTINNIVSEYSIQLNPETQLRARLMREGKFKPSAKTLPYYSGELLEEISTTKPFKQLPIKDKGSYVLNKLMQNVNTGALGQVGVQTGANLFGRGVGNVTYNNEDEYIRLKNYYKATQGENWRKFGKAMKPSKDNKPAYEAYLEITGDYD